MHMREAAAQGFSLEYRLFDLEPADYDDSTLPDLLAAIENAGYAGVNITHPCKQAVINHLDQLSADAADLGAVNTVIFQDNRRIGHNTDWSGFYRGFHKTLAGVPANRILQLGAGGAGSAVAYALARSGVSSMLIYDLDTDKSSLLVQRLVKLFPNIEIMIPDSLEKLTTGIDGIINTTPVGMEKHPGLPLPEQYVQSRYWFADVIYFPLQTELLRLARERTCVTMDGTGMAINQAVEAFRLFTGREANAERMADTFFNEFS